MLNLKYHLFMIFKSFIYFNINYYLLEFIRMFKLFIILKIYFHNFIKKTFYFNQFQMKHIQNFKILYFKFKKSH